MKTLNAEVLESRTRSVAAPGLDRHIAEVKSLILEGNDADLVDINPKAMARKKKLGTIPMLKAFLHLTKAGVFDMSWSVHCPHCKGATARAGSIALLHEHGTCPLCAQDFSASFDQNVALSFDVNPSVATVDRLDDFQLALKAMEFEPGIRIELEPGESHVLEMDLSSGNYGISMGEAEKIVNIPVGTHGGEKSGTTQALTVAFSPEDPPARSLPLKQGPARITITNRMSGRADFVIAKLLKPEWADAALVASLQEFRDLFSREMLSPNEAFSIQNLSIVFTDLKSSTEMYERLGDSKAFYLVKEHFRIMEDVVRHHDGGIVKTIGDAVMAVFSSPLQAMSAAREMIESFDDYNTRNHTQNNIIVKVGVHVGPCIAVTLNERIDYFGTTVNIAARIQGLSDGRDIMVSERVFAEAGSERLLEGSAWKWERFSTSLKGLKDTYNVYKLHRVAHS